MKKARLLLILGIWIVVLPYLGFPYSWRDTLTVLSGLGVIYVSYILYRQHQRNEVKKEKSFENFRENKFEIGNENK